MAAEIDLAPDHKRGLAAPNPILIAGGMVGYGEAVPRSLTMDHLGGVVVGPIHYASRAGSAPPRIAEMHGGFVRHVGQQNRGVAAVIRRFSKSWRRMNCPVIAQIAEREPERIGSVVEQLCAVSVLSGFELLPPHDGGIDLARTLLRRVLRHSDLPVWVKLPMSEAADWAGALIDDKPAGFVIGQPPQGALLRDSFAIGPLHLNDPHSDQLTNKLVCGEVYGPMIFAFMLRALNSVKQLNLQCALLACGGIHTSLQVRQALDSGARAVQVDSAVWVDPGLPGRLVKEMAVSSKADQGK